MVLLSRMKCRQVPRIAIAAFVSITGDIREWRCWESLRRKKALAMLVLVLQKFLLGMVVSQNSAFRWSRHVDVEVLGCVQLREQWWRNLTWKQKKKVGNVYSGVYTYINIGGMCDYRLGLE